MPGQSRFALSRLLALVALQVATAEVSDSIAINTSALLAMSFVFLFASFVFAMLAFFVQYTMQTLMWFVLVT